MSPRRKEPNVRTRAGKLYVRWLDGHGRWKEKATRATSVTEAAKMQRDLSAKAERQRLGLEDLPTDAGLSFGDFAESIYLPMASRLRGFKTVRGLVRRLVDGLGRVPLAKLTPEDVERLLADVRRAGRIVRGQRQEYAIKTIEGLRWQLRRMLNIAIKKKLMRAPNPATEVEGEKPPEEPPRYIPLDLAPRVIAAVPDRNRGLLATALYTGMRKGELFGLLVENVRLDERMILVERSHDSATTKTKQWRPVPIPEELVPFLRAELGRTRSRYLFPNTAGERRNAWENLPRMLAYALKAANIVDGYDLVCRRKTCRYVERRADDAIFPCPKCGYTLWPKGVPKRILFKDFRSTYATHGYERTGDIRFVQKVLGHKSLKTTERYARARDEHLLRQANKLNFGVTGPEEEEIQMLSGRHVASGEKLEVPAPAGFGKAPLVGDGYSERARQESNLRPSDSKSDAAGFGPGATQLHPAVSVDTFSRSVFHPTTHINTKRHQLSGRHRAEPRQGLKLGASGDALLKIREVAARLRIHVDTVRKLCRSGALRCVRIGNKIYVSEADLAEFIRNGGAK